MELKQYILENLDFYHFFLESIDEGKDNLDNYQNLYDFIERIKKKIILRIFF